MVFLRLQLPLALVDKSFTIFRAIDYVKEHEPNAKILYLVFNKRNQQEAEQKLRKYASWLQPVIVKTAHSYAYNKWMKTIGPFNVVTCLDWNIIQNVKSSSTYKYVPEVKYSKKAPFVWLHDKYCASKLVLDSFCEDMLDHWDDTYNGPDKPCDTTIITSKGFKKCVYGIPVDGYSYVSKSHIEAFKKVIKEHEEQKIYTHGMYLKNAAYSKRSGGDEFDYVFFDEAQDASFFMLKLLEKQTIHKFYFVGDERQSIYQFGCNVNVFKELSFDKTYTLTTSFRFGKSIANLATKILHLNSEHTVFGTEQTHQTNPKSIARLYRTNATLFQEALDCAYEAKCNGIDLKIDLMKAQEDETALGELLSFLKLYYKYKKNSYYREHETLFPKFTAPTLKNFEDALEKGEDFFNVYNDLYDFLSDNIHIMFNYAQKEEHFVEKYAAYQECLNNTDKNANVLCFCTMHRSKGMEWDNVTIAEPTRLYYTDKEGTVRRNSEWLQELNLAYVAVTRARKTLNAEIFKNELSSEKSKFNDICFTIKEGRQAYQVEQTSRTEELHNNGIRSDETYDDKDVCSKTYDPFWNKMLDASDMIDACDLC